MMKPVHTWCYMYATVKEKGCFKKAVVTSVASLCLHYGNQRMCTQLQPALILLVPWKESQLAYLQDQLSLALPFEMFTCNIPGTVCLLVASNPGS